MHKTMMMTVGTALLLTACAKPGPPPKPQPGSWSMKMELLDAQGPEADKIKATMGPMLNAMANMSICLTPEDAAKSDPTKSITNGSGDCKFDKQDVSSAGIHVAGTCMKNGVESKVAADGTISATAQDVTISTETKEPKSGGILKMKMRMQTQRTGECKPGDMKSSGGATL